MDSDSKRQNPLQDVFADSPVPALTEGSGRKDYQVKTPVFEGPLDLLLHLIRKEQLNIYDIPVAQICKSYFEQLQLMFEPDVNVAGEFFVMASTLLHLKSQILLPVDEQSLDENDPRLPLVAQLLEYERFKKAAQQIDAMPWLDRDLYARPASTAEVLPVESLLDAPLDPVDTFQLLLCLKIATDRTERPPIQISIDTTSLRERVTAVGNYLDEQDVITFASLVPPGTRRFDVILSFMAVLELAKLKFVEILQTEAFGPIQIRKVRSIRELNMGLLDQF